MQQLYEKLKAHLIEQEAALLAAVLNNAGVTEFRVENNEVVFSVSLIADLPDFRIRISALSMLSFNTKTFPITIDSDLIKINITTVKNQHLLQRPFLSTGPCAPSPQNACFSRVPWSVRKVWTDQPAQSEEDNALAMMPCDQNKM